MKNQQHFSGSVVRIMYIGGQFSAPIIKRSGKKCQFFGSLVLFSVYKELVIRNPEGQGSDCLHVSGFSGSRNFSAIRKAKMQIFYLPAFFQHN